MTYADVTQPEFKRLGRLGAVVVAGFDAGVLAALSYTGAELRWLIVAAVFLLALTACGAIREAALWIDARQINRSRWEQRRRGEL